MRKTQTQIRVRAEICCLKKEALGNKRRKTKSMKLILIMKLGITYHYGTKLVQPNYNCEACNLCFWQQKGGMISGVFPLGPPLPTENKLMSKDLSWPLQEFAKTKENSQSCKVPLRSNPTYDDPTKLCKMNHTIIPSFYPQVYFDQFLSPYVITILRQPFCIAPITSITLLV
jgi:hypothetical protein